MGITIESTSIYNNQFLSLLRLGIGNKAEPLQETVNWDAIEALAVRHGLLAIVYDAVQKLPESQRPPLETWLRWIGQVVQNYEQRYEVYHNAVDKLAAFYNAHGYRMMVLKGLACGMDWPNPSHRPYGDIDVWMFGKQKDADLALQKETGIKIDNSHHHHTVFNWTGFMVENHYDFVNVHALGSSRELEKIFKALGNSSASDVIHIPSDIYLPSANLHALFLVRHMVSHFAAAEMSLRQVLDWVFFVKKHSKEIDWKWLTGLLEQYHMKDFFDCINAICVEDLGFDRNIFPYIQSNDTLKNRVLSEIITPAYSAATPKEFMPRVVYKLRRWRGSAWKQELCYPESRFLIFVGGVWHHLLKPAGI